MDYMIETEEVFFDRVTSIPGKESIGLVILANKDKTRQITFICDRAMALEIEIRVNTSLKEKPNNRICDIAASMLKRYCPSNCSIVIQSVNCGKFNTKLVMGDTEADITSDNALYIRLSDAVLLSLCSGTPLLATHKLLQQISTRYMDPASNAVNLPISILTDKMLADALEKALKEERYELASRLRDEQQARKDAKEKE